MESLVFSVCLELMVKEAYLGNQGRGARWVGRGFLATLGREDHQDQMENLVIWEPLALVESMVLLVTWDQQETWAYQDPTD